MSGSLRQWESTQDGLENLELREAALPEPGEDEVLVKITAVSLNFRDTEVCMGLYGHHKSIQQRGTIVPCSDACGVVERTGANLKVPWKVGDRVLTTFMQTHLTGQIQPQDMASGGLGLPQSGVLCTHRVFPSTGLVRAPKFLSDREACTLPIASVTAWMSLFYFEQRSLEGKVVLLIGTGGVAIAGLQLARASGAATIILSSSDEKLRRAKELGADHTINYKTHPDWSKVVMEITNDRGADIIFELGGASTTTQSFNCVAFGGFIASIGYVGGKQDAPDDRLNVNVLALRRNVTVQGIINGPRDQFEAVCKFYEEHAIHPVIDRTFGFNEAREAFKYLYSGGHFGKVVVEVQS